MDIYVEHVIAVKAFLNDTYEEINNASWSEELRREFSTASYIVLIGMLLLALATVMGNLSIILCVLKSRRLSSKKYTVYVVSLAVSDILIGFVCMPIMAVYTFFGYWPLGSIACTMWIIIDYTCCSVSNMHLSAIAFDRFRAVSNPLHYRSTFTKRTARVIAMVTWAIGLLYWVPGILIFRMLEHGNGSSVEDSECANAPNYVDIVGEILLTMCGPSIVMIALYVLLVITLRKRTISQPGKQEFKQTIDAVSDQATNLDAKQPNHKQTGEENKVTAQNQRCLVTLIALVVVFLLCWLPWCCAWAISAYCDTCVSSVAFTACYWVVYMNSTINPCLYFVLNKDFREAFPLISCSKKLFKS